MANPDSIAPTLFEMAPVEENGSSAFKDPAFGENKKSPVHRWVPWIAGFSRQFVRGALETYLSGKGTVLDPFAGVGTTLVEAMLAGHDVSGFEINPYAALACRTKLEAWTLEANCIRRAIRDFEQFYTEATSGGYEPSSRIPAGFKSRLDFYSPKVLKKVLIVQDFIRSRRNSVLRDMFRLAFASTMVTFSNYSYEPSLSTRASAGKANVEDYPVGPAIKNKVMEMARDVEWLQAQINGHHPEVDVYNESFFRCRERLRSGCVDLVVTSPPYLNNYHYNRNTRPHLYWLGFAQSPSDFKPLEEENFGKFWQTVREREHVALDFEADDREIGRTLDELRSRTPEKGLYGGNGWANYAASYFNDCHRFARELKFVLKRRATALVVIGNSILQGVMIPTDRFFAKIAESVGLQVVDIHIPRGTRVGNSIIQSGVRVAKAQDSDRLYEAVVELRKR